MTLIKEDVLHQVGLTEAEARLYLVLLGNGEATASQLAKKTATNRTFTYDRLNKLMNLGLASHITKENKRYFRAAEPNQLLSILKERESQVQSIMPELETLKAKAREGPQVTVFSSKRGMQTALNIMLREKKPILMQGSLVNFQKAMSQSFEVWNSRE
jgi:HTH-type transcriptional regulator, sugar sensing transcriptional regulator